MKEYKVSESKSLIHLDHGDLAVISLALGSGTARELFVISVAADGTEPDWKPRPALPVWLCTLGAQITACGCWGCDAVLHQALQPVPGVLKLFLKFS